jgi:hypothetical protein
VATTDSAPAPEPASARRLLRSTAIAAAVAIAILVTIVLPAEYGVDPTGVGRILGLKEMGEIKMELVKEEAQHAAEEAAAAAASEAPATPAPSATSPVDSLKLDSTDVVLLPSEGKEIKLVMNKDAKVTYSWTTDRGVVNYDTHADSPTIRYHGYGKGTAAKSDEGVLTAAFDGQHGWFWRNRSSDTITVTLRTRGDYQELKRMQ